MTTATATIPEIHEILDGDFWSGTCGYWCEGPVDKQQFAIACNQGFDLADQESPVHVSEVKHGYFTKATVDGDGYELEDGSYLLNKCKVDAPRSFAATYVWY